MRRKVSRSLVTCIAIAGFFVPAHAGTPSCVTKAPAPLQNSNIPSGQTCYWIVAGPGAQFVNYANPVVVVPRGTAIGWANLDTASHDVSAGTASAPLYGSDTEACATPKIPGGPRPFPVGQCPLFWSPTTGIGVADVFGLENIPKSSVPVIYDFYCRVHPYSGQAGKLAILDT